MIKKLLFLSFLFSFSIQISFAWQDTIYESDTLEVIASHEGIDVIDSDGFESRITKVFIGGLVSDGIYISPNENIIIYQSEERNLILYNIPNKENLILRSALSGKEYYEKYLSKTAGIYEYRISETIYSGNETIYSISWSPDSEKILIVSEFSAVEEVFYCIHDINNFEEDSQCRSRGIQATYIGYDEKFHINNEGQISVENSVYPEIDNITTSPFTDLLQNYPLYDHVLQAVEDGWINGYPDNTIQLEKTVNRAEFAKILTLALHPEEETEIPLPTAYPSFEDIEHFSDVEEYAWYVPFLAKAVQLGLMKGYSDITIKPAQTINAAEALKMSLFSTSFTRLPEKGEVWFEQYRVFASDNLNLTSMNLDIESMSMNITRGMVIELISLVKGLEE